MIDGKGHVLVVDDEVELKNILCEALTAQGFEVSGFTSGRDALVALHQRVFDILLTDLMMPEMDGITLVRHGLEIDPDLICIMMTGQGTIQTAVDAMKAGAFDYVLKPFKLQTILPMLTRAMNLRHLRLENVHLREAVAIHELGQTIAFTLDPQTVLNKLADAALVQSEADEVSVLLPAADAEEFYVAAVRGEKRERLLGERVPFGDSISSWVAREHEPVILNGAIDDDRFAALWPRPEIRSSVSIPLLVSRKLIGVLNVNLINRPRNFTPGEMKALTILASTAAAALESASLYTQVETQRQRLDNIVATVPGIVWEVQIDADRGTERTNFVSSYTENLLGYTVEEVLSTPNFWQTLVHPDDRAEVERATAEIYAKGGKGRQECRYITKSGDTIWVESNYVVLQNAEGCPTGIRGVTIDRSGPRRAEQALRESEERYRDLVENAHDIIFSHDLNGRYTSVNRAGIRITGYSHEESLQRNLADTVAPECQAKAREMIARKVAGEEVTSYEIEILARDGRRIPVEINTKLMYHDGVPVGVQGIARDITERKRAEEVLAALRRELEMTMNSMAEGVHRVNLNGKIVFENPAAVQMLGWNLCELIGRPAHATMHHTHANGTPYPVETCPIYATLRDGVSRRVEDEVFWRQDGTSFPVEYTTSAMRNEKNEIIAVVVNFRDVTERKQAQAQLTQLAAAVEQTADSIIITDTDGAIEYVNPAFENTTGYTREEALGQNPRILKSGRTKPEVYRDLWQTVTSGKVWVGQLENRRKDGTFFTERVTISAIRDQSGEIVHYLAVKQDITREIELEQQLRQSQKMEAIGQLAGGVAHDFNNLLTAINGYSDLGLQRSGEHNPVRKYLEEIRKAGDRAGNLTRQLLAFGRKQVLQPVPLNLNDVVTDLNKMLTRLIGEDIKLTAKLDPALKKVQADPGQIEQVIVNLVVNARDAMPEGGNLTIETANTEVIEEVAAKHIGVVPGNYVVLAVTDNGVGMDGQTKARIFEPFFTTKELGKGTGLGLSTVYGIVKQSAGNIWVYSEPGKGTSFKIYLPEAANTTVQAKKETVDQEAIATGEETILLVEDEEIVRRLAEQILEQAGYSVLSACGGDEALQLCVDQKEKIDLLLTDVVMAGASGKEVAARLSNLVPGIKVLFMSGYTDDAIVHHGVLDADVEFIQKPFTALGLSRKVRDVLDRAPSC